MKMIQGMKENFQDAKLIFFPLMVNLHSTYDFIPLWSLWNFNDDLDSGVDQML